MSIFITYCLLAGIKDTIGCKTLVINFLMFYCLNRRLCKVFDVDLSHNISNNTTILRSLGLFIRFPSVFTKNIRHIVFVIIFENILDINFLQVKIHLFMTKVRGSTILKAKHLTTISSDDSSVFVTYTVFYFKERSKKTDN